MKTIRHLVLSLALVLGLTAAVAVPAVAHADDSKNTVCSAINGGGGCDPDNSGGTSVNKVIGAVVNILSLAVGVVAVVMVVIAGFKYMTSGGDSSSIASAKNTLIYAIVGLVIASLAYVIVHFVLAKLS